jgi:hypothetical protein
MRQQTLTYSRKEISLMVNFNLDISVNAVLWRATSTDAEFWHEESEQKDADITKRSSVSTTMSIAVSDDKDANASSESGRVYPGDSDEVFVK